VVGVISGYYFAVIAPGGAFFLVDGFEREDACRHDPPNKFVVLFDRRFFA
jgi:hypothetical protein